MHWAGSHEGCERCNAVYPKDAGRRPKNTNQTETLSSLSFAHVMTDNPHPRAEKVTAIPISDAPHASFIYFENAPAYGFANGVVNITLSANRTYAGPDGAAVNEQVVVAYLRGNIPAALALRKAIDKALLLAAPTAQKEVS